MPGTGARANELHTSTPQKHKHLWPGTRSEHKSWPPTNTASTHQYGAKSLAVIATRTITKCAISHKAREYCFLGEFSF